ncbi:MAG: VWA domain-containing protein [Gammaproteobacteria bacterium]
MIEFAFPWAALLAPLPWLVRRGLPATRSATTVALRVPFFSALKQTAGRRARGGWRIRAVLPLLAWFCLVAAAMQPRWLGEVAHLPTTGRDLLLVIDISGSMRAMDFGTEADPRSRLDVVKEVAGRFVSRRGGDRVGLILFGSRPYLRVPLTYDREAVVELLQDTEVALAGEYTALGDAIGLGVRQLRHHPAGSRVLVVLTDGASNAGGMGPKQAAEVAAQEGVRIHTIAIGRDDVVAPNLAGTWSAEAVRAFNREILQSIASRTGGVYMDALDPQGLERAYRNLDELEPTLGADLREITARPLYPWLVLLGLLLSWLAAFNAWRPGRRSLA